MRQDARGGNREVEDLEEAEEGGRLNYTEGEMRVTRDRGNSQEVGFCYQQNGEKGVGGGLKGKDDKEIL